MDQPGALEMRDLNEEKGSGFCPAAAGGIRREF